MAVFFGAVVVTCSPNSKGVDWFLYFCAMNKPIIIGSRGSELALWQANYAAQLLQDAGFMVEIKVIKTRGDAIQHLSFSKMEGKGFFTKELEDALLQGSIDLAVHSYKDVPTQPVSGLTIAAVSYREDPFDVLVIHPNACNPALPLSLKQEAIVGTSAARRKSQLRALRPDLQLTDIRGNVPTRLAKVGNGCDAVVLAFAGLKRLNLISEGYILIQLTPLQMVPAPAQGVLAYQIRENDVSMQQAVQYLHDPNVAQVVALERNILHGLGGGCQQPIGVYCNQLWDKTYQLWVTQSGHEQDFPNRVYLKGNNATVLEQKALHILHAKNAKTLFISRNLPQDSYFLKAMQQRQYAVHAQSLIQFTPVTFNPQIPPADWIFFSSKNAVKFFFDQNPVLHPQIQLAAISKGTAQAIAALGYEVAFEGGSYPPQTAAWFAEKASGKTVIFPQAANAQMTVQQHAGNAIKAINLTVYENTPIACFALPASDILVFTSPLNVETYCKKYAIHPHQTVIAIGETTARALVKHQCSNYLLPYAPDEVSLADVCW
ncbi:MAG TPA: hydroxymethylbilane synthase [Chitinophagales bacterium]|nr:hydroxymethylbilane synthase [Chitinophagales bacterium]